MARRLVLSLCAAATASSLSLSFDAEAAKKNPVHRVLGLLQGMQKQLEKEGKEDEESFEKQNCWCKTNIKEKTASVKGVASKTKELQSKVSELTAATGRLDVELKGLANEVEKNKKSLDQAADLRGKQRAAFQAEEKDLVTSIEAVKGALITLSKGKKGGALLQLPAVLARRAELLEGMVTPAERNALEAFIQSDEDKPSATQQVIGVLNQMTKTFTDNLATARADEAKGQKSFEGLRDAKNKEINAGKSQIDAKKQERADADVKLAQAKQDIENVAGNAAKDAEFLKVIQAKCQKSNADWEQRKKDRAEEVEAVSKAQSVLTSDDAREMFKKSLSFLQVDSAAELARRNKAVELLAAAGKRLDEPRLTMLAVTAKLDGFVRVKKAIDDMAAALEKEQVDETQKKEFCLNEIAENRKKRAVKAQTKTDKEAQAEDSTQTMTKATGTITANNKTITELKLQLQKAAASREKAKKDLADVVADQRQTQDLLQKAIAVLEGFYNKKAAAKPAFVQTEDFQAPAAPAAGAAPPAEPAGLKEYKKNGASSGVVLLLKQIAEDSKKAEQAALKSDKDSESTYQAVVKDTGVAVKGRTEDTTDKTAVKAKAEGELVQTQEAIRGVTGEIHTLIQTRDQLHMTCDFLVQNFELRKGARSQEIESLKEAKAVLSGAKLGFLQSVKRHVP